MEQGLTWLLRRQADHSRPRVCYARHLRDWPIGRGIRRARNPDHGSRGRRGGPTRPLAAPSAQGLRDSHILLSHSNSITRGHCGQLVPASPHGLRTCWLIVAIPSAEAGNDPGKPSERAWFMTVLLARGVSFERRADSFGGGDEAVIGDIGCRPRAAIP